eukprot:9912880-Karenia_brevis.AAC.1
MTNLLNISPDQSKSKSKTAATAKLNGSKLYLYQPFSGFSAGEKGQQSEKILVAYWWIVPT